MEPSLQNNVNGTNGTQKTKILLGIAALIIVVFLVIFYIKKSNTDVEVLETEAERQIRSELQAEAPAYTPQTAESIRAELAKPPTVESGGGLSQEEMERIRQELRK